MSPISTLFRHSGEGRNPDRRPSWVPAFAGMTAMMFAVSACDAPPRPPVAGPEARKLVDTETLAYADCVVKGAEAAPLGESPGLAVAKVVRGCAPRREALATAIEKFHAIGHPSFTPEQTEVVAEASIQQIEPEIRSDAIAVYVGRALPAEKAQ